MTLAREKALSLLRAKAARWALDNAEALKSAEPQIPDELTNARMRDNFRPLLAIADAAGGHWPSYTREVAILATDSDESQSISELLISDLHKLFNGNKLGGETLETTKILEYLHELDSRPWAEWGRLSKPITAHGVAKLLKPFEITPDHWRDGARTVRGYRRGDFGDAFQRYALVRDNQNGTRPKINELQEFKAAQNVDSVPIRNDGNLFEPRDCAGCAESTISQSRDDDWRPKGGLQPEGDCTLDRGEVGQRHSIQAEVEAVDAKWGEV